uniref:Uncharacterized protein n=1 Tax=Anguilla anguilla TaxID=7936 RepID=A0A0E9P996_ANGAN
MVPSRKLFFFLVKDMSLSVIFYFLFSFFLFCCYKSMETS